MANKTLRLYFRVESADGSTPVATSINAGGTTTSSNLAHTNNWVGDQEAQDDDTLRTFDITVTAKDINDADFDEVNDSYDTIGLSISPTGGDILLMGMSENYTYELSANPDYDPSVAVGPDNPEYVNIDTGANFCSINCGEGPVISSQPLVDGVADSVRYDFSGTIIGGDADGTGNGCVGIYDGETVQFDVRYNAYTPASA